MRELVPAAELVSAAVTGSGIFLPRYQRSQTTRVLGQVEHYVCHSRPSSDLLLPIRNKRGEIFIRLLHHLPFGGSTTAGRPSMTAAPADFTSIRRGCVTGSTRSRAVLEARPAGRHSAYKYDKEELMHEYRAAIGHCQ